MQDLRRRLRYLSHLPLTCEFVMAELELRPPIVSQFVLDTFKGLLLNETHPVHLLCSIISLLCVIGSLHKHL